MVQTHLLSFPNTLAAPPGDSSSLSKPLVYAIAGLSCTVCLCLVVAVVVTIFVWCKRNERHKVCGVCVCVCVCEGDLCSKGPMQGSNVSISKR